MPNQSNDQKPPEQEHSHTSSNNPNQIFFKHSEKRAAKDKKIMDEINPLNINDNPKLISDIKTINDILSNKDCITKQLEKLEKLLQDEKSKRTDSNSEKKLLSAVLYQWAMQHGFTKVIKLKKILSREDFQKLLSQGLLVKDCSLELGIHGEWSHIIQWLIIAEASQQQEFQLHHKPVELYTIMGNLNYVDHNSKSDNTLWDKLFDRMYRNTDHSEGQLDFRSPENLMNKLRYSGKEQFPLLGNKLDNRHKKRVGNRFSFKIEKLFDDKPQDIKRKLPRTF